MDNRERAGARHKKKQRRTISLEEKHENFITPVRMVAATKMKMKEMYKKKCAARAKSFFC